MRMRFWDASTRDKESAVRMRLLSRALDPKARSHDPITAPERLMLVYWLRISPASKPTGPQAHRLIETVG